MHPDLFSHHSATRRARQDFGEVHTTSFGEGETVSFAVIDESHQFARAYFPGVWALHTTTAQKENTPMDRTEIIENRLRELEAELADIRRFGEDNYDEGQVLTFKGDFGGSKTYAYAAIKAGGRWYITGGKGPQGTTWADLVEFLRGANVRKVRRVTGTERVV